jgi:hypothetical protein
MSDSSAPTSRPVSLVTVIAIFGAFALFLIVAYYVYVPRQTGAFVDDGMHTPTQRKKTLSDLRETQTKQATTYGWVDEKAKVVRLPIARAMELTAQEQAAAKK